jgi:ribosomal-protein-alanine N-acetyltransferase
LIDKENNKIIGTCGYHNWYKEHNRAELGYTITNEVYKGLGVMSEAMKVVLEHGFVKMKLHRIEALVGTQNVASIKLLEKFGFTKEGVLKEHHLINDVYEDSIVYGKVNG